MGRHVPLCIGSVLFVYVVFTYVMRSTCDDDVAGAVLLIEATALTNKTWVHGCNGTLPRIHFPLSVTSHKLKPAPKVVRDLPLVRFALRSIIETIEPHAFDYAIYIGADAGDPWYDSAVNAAAIIAWFQSHYRITWGVGACIPPLEFYVYNNTRSHPIWAVNYVTQLAYERGYEYSYFINDDSVLSNDGWSSLFVSELASFRPLPNHGVTGPWDAVQKGAMLTHSFVHITHLRIYGTRFNFHYPNTYSDTALQAVYAPPYPVSFGPGARMMSILKNVTVKHVRLPTRYEEKAVNQTERINLHQRQVDIDRENLRLYMERVLKIKKITLLLWLLSLHPHLCACDIDADVVFTARAQDSETHCVKSDHSIVCMRACQ